MVKHIVLWKLADSAEGKRKEENAQIIKSTIEDLKKSIPQIIKIEIGFNYNQSDAAYDVALYSEFASHKDLEIYQDHPEHKKVADFISKVRIARVVADYII
jgi:hypothetical protein